MALYTRLHPHGNHSQPVAYPLAVGRDRVNQKPIRSMGKPRREVDKARFAINRMQTAVSFRSQQEIWVEFLGALERAWYKTVSVLRTKPGFKDWTDLNVTEKLRDTDPLLSYLRYARGAAEHSVEEVTVGEQSIGINPAYGNVLYIKGISFVEGNMLIDSPQPLRVTVTNRVRLLPVRSRRHTYNPPTAHLNAALTNSDPIYIGERGIEFYQSFIDKAEKFLME